MIFGNAVLKRSTISSNGTSASSKSTGSACSETNPDPARVGRRQPGEILGDQGIRLQRQQHRAGRHPAGGHRVEQKASELHRVGQVTGEVCVMLAHHDAVVPDLAGPPSLATQHLDLLGRREVVRIEPSETEPGASGS